MTGGLLCGQRPRNRNSSEAMLVNLVRGLQLREVSDTALASLLLESLPHHCPILASYGSIWSSRWTN
jgi:hypothetical protein